MRICLVADGRSEHISRLSQFLMEAGHEVHLVCWKKRDSLPEKITLHQLKTIKLPLLREIYWIIQAVNQIHKIKPDVVDGHYISVYGFVAAISGYHPLIVTAWGSDVLIDPFKNRLQNLTTRFALSRADKIAALFDLNVAEEKLQRLGTDVSRFKTYYLGVDIDQFQRNPDGKKIKSRFGLSETGPVVLFTRGLAPVYDVETLISAIPTVLNSVPQTQFVIVYNPVSQQIVDDIKKRSGVFEKVKFLPFIPRHLMPELLSAADIYVSTSLSDGASNALFEAMACELAPVVTDIPANRVWIKEGENGLLFKVKDYTALAEKIILLINKPELRMAFARKCRQVAVTSFSQKDQVSKIIEMYENAVSGRKQPTGI